MAEVNDIEKRLYQLMLLHLSEAELGAYNDNAVIEVDRLRMESHLDRCLICSRKLQMMRDVMKAKNESAAEHDIALAKAFLGRRRAAAAVVGSIVLAFNLWAKQKRICPGLKTRFSSARVEDGQVEDGSIRWRYVEKESGERIIRFGSHRMELAGVAMIVTAGKVTRTTVLKSVTEDQVGAEVSFSAQEIEIISAGDVLSIDILTKA